MRGKLREGRQREIIPMVRFSYNIVVIDKRTRTARHVTSSGWWFLDMLARK